MRTAVVAVIFGALVSVVAPARAAEYVSSDAMMPSRAGCESCGQQAMMQQTMMPQSMHQQTMMQQTMSQQTMQPPWHRNVRPPPSSWGCQPSCGPAMPCGPSMGCGPECDPCCEPQAYRLPPCFPRLHALFCDGYLLSPTPPRPPRCPQCGCHISDGF